MQSKTMVIPLNYVPGANKCKILCVKHFAATTFNQ